MELGERIANGMCEESLGRKVIPEWYEMRETGVKRSEKANAEMHSEENPNL
jgi:hypothetical protein